MIGKGQGEAPISPDATLEAPQAQGSTAAAAACGIGAAQTAEDGGTGPMAAAELIADAPPTGASGPGAGKSLPAATGGAVREDVAAASAPLPSGTSPAFATAGLAGGPGGLPRESPSQSDRAPGPAGSEEAEWNAFSGAAGASTLAPPKGDLLVALAREPDANTPVRSIDVTTDGNASSAVILAVTPASTGTGVLLDHAGHVLANWHVVRGYPGVSVSFKASAGASPSAALTRPVRVIRLSKTSDLALLRVGDPPAGITPVPIAKTNEIRNGDVVHAVGHPSNGVWTYTPGKIDQVKPGSSWYAGHDLLHRGTVITADLPDDPGGAGAPLFNNRLELVGIGTMPRSIRGLLTGVSVETIRRFLQAPPAQARTSTGGWPRKGVFA